jgi:hypothetical protein
VVEHQPDIITLIEQSMSVQNESFDYLLVLLPNDLPNGFDGLVNLMSS